MIGGLLITYRCGGRHWVSYYIRGWGALLLEMEETERKSNTVSAAWFCRSVGASRGAAGTVRHSRYGSPKGPLLCGSPHSFRVGD